MSLDAQGGEAALRLLRRIWHWTFTVQENVNYYYVISYLDSSLPAAKCFPDWGGITSSESKTGSIQHSLDEYWRIIQGAGSRMTLISLLRVSNGRSPPRAAELTACAPPQQISESFLLASAPNTLLLMLPDGLVNLGDAFWSREGITQSSLNH